MSIDTGAILDAVVLSKTCSACQKHLVEKSPEEFKLWKLNTKKVMNVSKTMMGPSAKMETADAKNLWGSSERITICVITEFFLMATARLLPH